MKKNEEMVSLNRSLEAEFEVTELEQRLETDPLLFIDILTHGIEPASVCDGYTNCVDGYDGSQCPERYTVCNKNYQF